MRQQLNSGERFWRGNAGRWRGNAGRTFND